jgi:hypothetical protein
MPKDMYQSKKLLSALSMEYEKTDVCKDTSNGGGQDSEEEEELEL